MLGFQMRSFLVLTLTSPSLKQAGNPAFWGLFCTHRPHRKAPLRGARDVLTHTPVTLAPAVGCGFSAETTTILTPDRLAASETAPSQDGGSLRRDYHHPYSGPPGSL